MKCMLLTRIFFNKLTLSGRPAQDGPAKRGDTEPKSPDALEGEAHQIRTQTVTRGLLFRLPNSPRRKLPEVPLTFQWLTHHWC